MAKITDAFSIIRNGANIKQGLDDSGYPITRIETISNRTVDRNKMGYAGVTDISKYSDYVLQDGDLLMSHINSETHLGKVALYEKQEDETIIHGMNLLCLRPKKELLDSRYAFYYLSSDAFLRQIPRITKKSVNQASFNVGALKDLIIPIPKIEKQRDIVRGLDKVTELIALRKEQLAKLDQLVKSRFIELFGTVKDNPYHFPTATLKEVCHKITDGKHGGCEQEADSGYYYVGAREIYDGSIHYDTAPQITYADFAKDYRRCNIEQGDMVIVNTGATIGKSAIASSPLTERTLLQKSVALLKVKTEVISAEFLRYCYMANPSMYMVESASAQPNLLLSKMNATVIYLPPIELQEQFAAFVEQTDKSKLAIQQSLDKLELLKKSLMREYFG